jgi:hypothetical protein
MPMPRDPIVGECAKARGPSLIGATPDDAATEWESKEIIASREQRAIARTAAHDKDGVLQNHPTVVAKVATAGERAVPEGDNAVVANVAAMALLLCGEPIVDQHALAAADVGRMIFELEAYQ